MSERFCHKCTDNALEISSRLCAVIVGSIQSTIANATLMSLCDLASEGRASPQVWKEGR